MQIYVHTTIMYVHATYSQQRRRAVQKSDQVVLVGHVTGASLAYEMAMQFQEADIEAPGGEWPRILKSMQREFPKAGGPKLDPNTL